MDNFLSLIQKFKNTSVLCVGDLMLDLFVYGDVSRISPEAPIPILKVNKEFHTLGGAGNVVNNLLSAGAKPHILSIIGADANAKTLCILLEEKGIHSNLIQDPHITTIEKRRFSTKTQQLLRVDYEQDGFFPDNLYQRLVETALRLLPQVQVLILSDYGKGVLHPEKVIQPLIKAAKLKNIPIIVDPKGKDYSIYKGATLVTPNRKELHDATQLPTNTDDEIITAAAHIIQNCQIENVLATRSEDGMTFITNKGTSYHYKAEAKEVYDVSGAGDTVVAIMAATLGAGGSFEEACYLSNGAGSIVVGKIGTATISDEELRDFCRAPLPQGQGKLLSLKTLMEIVNTWHQKGHKIGFTNGCFDLLHQGHLKILKEAKAVCDKLIVGINSDQSVKRLKGPNRPINDQETRAALIGAMEFVDAVLIFEEDTPLKVIQALAPNVLVKGADYKPSDVVGAEFVQQKGGKVVLVELEPGRSSTSIINKIQN